jgi:hypothetical protein
MAEALGEPKEKVLLECLMEAYPQFAESEVGLLLKQAIAHFEE